MQFIEISTPLLIDLVPLIIFKSILNEGVVVIFKLCCVSQEWNAICHNIIVSNYSSKKLTSNRFLLHFYRDETLEIESCFRISCEPLRKFSNLKSLKTRNLVIC